eukprot:SAG11_NODE_6736_length_1257_cov_1.369603_1_plen_321_part_10
MDAPNLVDVLRLGEVLFQVACPMLSARDLAALACSSRPLFGFIPPALLATPSADDRARIGDAGRQPRSNEVAPLDGELSALSDEIAERTAECKSVFQLQKQLKQLQLRRRSLLAATRRPLAERQHSLTWAIRATTVLIRMQIKSPVLVWGDCSRHVFCLAGHVSDGDHVVRSAALQALRAVGEQAAPVVDCIVAQLDDEHESVRADALRALCAVGTNAATHKAAAVAVAARLSDSDIGVKMEAVRVLGALSEGGTGRVDPLMKLLLDAEPSLRVATLEALATATSRASLTAAQLARVAERMQDGESSVRRAALVLLTVVGD